MDSNPFQQVPYSQQFFYLPPPPYASQPPSEIAQEAYQKQSVEWEKEHQKHIGGIPRMPAEKPGEKSGEKPGEANTDPNQVESVYRPPQPRRTRLESQDLPRPPQQQRPSRPLQQERFPRSGQRGVLFVNTQHLAGQRVSPSPHRLQRSYTMIGRPQGQSDVRVKHCTYCEMIGQPIGIYAAHNFLRDSGDVVNCKRFRDQGCRLCGANQDYAHVETHCRSWRGNNDPDFERFAEGFIIEWEEKHKPQEQRDGQMARPWNSRKIYRNSSMQMRVGAQPNRGQK